ncbi:SWIM zinc finger family protein [Streptomyces sp. NPDC057654]|uniref:SWIM zinc finger family protein n=1 Tax=Streptomyces sp. NPDC057654 TaxID=3346196 RepID=UPI0036AE548F
MTFAESWWGNAWIEALGSASLDPGRLSRGRAYARGGHVHDITVTPGRIGARVDGSRSRPYRTGIGLDVLSDADWDRFLTAVAAQPSHIAALLDKDMPHALVDAAAEAGVRLLPGPGELSPRCSCPDRGHPCKHAAALCYEAALLLDADPLVLLLMRGRDERALLDDLARRNAAHASRESPAVRAGVDARTALFAPPAPAALPGPLPVPRRPGIPPSLPPARRLPVAATALDLLATDAAARAHAFLTTGGDPHPGLTPWQDAVRLAATRPTSGLTATTRTLYRSLAAGTGRTPTDMARAVAAWRQGGLEGLTLLEAPWNPPAGPFDRARPALAAAGLPPLRPRHNHLTDDARGLQLRFGHDGRWYPYEADPGPDPDWWPAGPADEDPVDALSELRQRDESVARSAPKY